MKKGLLLLAAVLTFTAAVGCDNQKSSTPSAFHAPPNGISGNDATGQGGKKPPPPKGENAAPVQP